jgi:hypothetical protein
MTKGPKDDGTAAQLVAREALDVIPRKDKALTGAHAGGALVHASAAAAEVALILRVAVSLPRYAVQGLYRAWKSRARLPPERRAPPDIPLLTATAAGYAAAPDELRERYANLMAASLDLATASRAHPAFVEFLKQMTTTEVRLVDLLPKEPERFHSFDALAGAIKAPASAIPVALANLVRLNLVTVRHNGFTEPLGHPTSRMSLSNDEWREIRYAILVDRELAIHVDRILESKTREGVTEIYEATALAREFYEVCSGQAWPTGPWETESPTPLPPQ